MACSATGRSTGNTEADYRWRLRRHLLPFFGEHRLDEIDGELCLAFKAHKIEGGARTASGDRGGRRSSRDERGRRSRPLGPASIRKLIGLPGRDPRRGRRGRTYRAQPGAQQAACASRCPKPPRTFLELDELVALIDAAGEQDALGDGGSQQRPASGATAARSPSCCPRASGQGEIAGELGLAQGDRQLARPPDRRDGPASRTSAGARSSRARRLSGVRVSELCDMRIRHVRLHDRERRALPRPGRQD